MSGTNGGLFPWYDGGATFSSKKNEGMSSYLIYALTGNPTHTDDVLIGLQDNGTRWRVGPTGVYNQVFGGDGFGVAWSQADDLISLGSVYYSFIIRNRRNPANTSNKWEVGWTGIPELNNPTLSYFRTSLATPSATADPTGLTFFHRTVYKLYRTINGAGSWQKVFETNNPNPPDGSQTAGRVLLRAGMHPIGISPVNINHFGVLGNGGHAFYTADGGATWLKKVITSPPFVAPSMNVDTSSSCTGFLPVFSSFSSTRNSVAFGSSSAKSSSVNFVHSFASTTDTFSPSGHV